MDSPWHLFHDTLFFSAVLPEPSNGSSVPWDGEKATAKKSKGKRRAASSKKGVDQFNKDDSDEEETTVNATSCAVCKTDFQSKNKLFSHLKSSGHAVPLAKK